MLPLFQEPILGLVKVPRIEEAFDSRNLLPSTALDPKYDIKYILRASFYVYLFKNK